MIDPPEICTLPPVPPEPPLPPRPPMPPSLGPPSPPSPPSPPAVLIEPVVTDEILAWRDTEPPFPPRPPEAPPASSPPSPPRPPAPPTDRIPPVAMLLPVMDTRPPYPPAPPEPPELKVEPEAPAAPSPPDASITPPTATLPLAARKYPAADSAVTAEHVATTAFAAVRLAAIAAAGSDVPADADPADQGRVEGKESLLMLTKPASPPLIPVPGMAWPPEVRIPSRPPARQARGLSRRFESGRHTRPLSRYSKSRRCALRVDVAADRDAAFRGRRQLRGLRPGRGQGRA